MRSSPRRWLRNSKDRHAEIFFVVFQQQRNCGYLYYYHFKSTVPSRFSTTISWAIYDPRKVWFSIRRLDWKWTNEFCFHVCLILCSLCSLLNGKELSLSWPDIVVAYHSCCFFKVASWFLVHGQVLFAIFGSEIGVDSPMFGFPLWDG